MPRSLLSHHHKSRQNSPCTTDLQCLLPLLYIPVTNAPYAPGLFRIDGYIQKDFFDSEEEIPEYSLWKNLREFCFSLIKGKKTPLGFHFVFSLNSKNISRLIEQKELGLNPADVQGLYLNIRYDGTHLTCVTGTSFKSFMMDKTLEREWDEPAEDCAAALHPA